MGVASLPRLPGLLIDKYPGREVGQGRAAPGGFNLDREAPCPWYDGKTGRKKHHKKTKAGPLPCSACRSVLDQSAIEARTPIEVEVGLKITTSFNGHHLISKAAPFAFW